MALTVNKNVARGLNTMGYWVGTLFSVTGDNSYPTGGWSLTASQLKLGVIELLQSFTMVKSDGTSAVHAAYDYTNAKLQCFWSAGSGSAPLEVGNTTDLSAYSGRSVAFGKG